MPGQQYSNLSVFPFSGNELTMMGTIATEAKTSLSKNNFSVYTVQCEIAFSNKVDHRTIITRTKKAVKLNPSAEDLYFKLGNADQVSSLGIIIKDSH